MSHLLRTAIALLAVTGLGPRRRSWALLITLGLWLPAVAVAIAAAIVIWRVRSRLHRDRRDSEETRAELGTLGDLVSIGLTSGMSVAQALVFASEELQSGLRGEVEAVVRGMSRSGSMAVLAAAGGVGGRLYLLVGRAMATGASVVTAVETFVDEAHAEERARHEAAARRLPVLLVFPLALLILPGFVLLVIAPAFLGGLERVGL